MNSTITLVAVFLAIALVSFLLLQLTKGWDRTGAKKPLRKDRAAIIRNASQKLAQNPRDVQALLAIGGLYYEEQNWEKAFSAYNSLSSLASSHPGEIDEFECTLRYGICALKLNRMDAAKKGLLAARKIRPSDPELNYNLGYVLYLEKDYEKAAPLFRAAVTANPENIQARRCLGLVLQKLNHYREALMVLRKVLEVYPEDKEALFSMGECFYETGGMDRALKVFVHLRADPVFGPQAALYSGIIHTQMEMNEKAAEDFEIGLKHPNLSTDIAIEMRYRYALLLIKMQELGRATVLLKDIQRIRPGYKDVSTLIARYQELNNNRNLQTYLLANQSEFTMLCRKIVSQFYTNAKVKVTEISVLGDYTDIVTDIDTPKWADIVIFRFFRSQGVIGELSLRDLYGRIKDLKAGRGICFSAGMFSEESKRFIEGRPIDLYNKDSLKRILDRVDSGRQLSGK